MPIYEYDCFNCNRTLEAIQKIDEQPLKNCPRCGEKGLKKKASLNSFQLKGSGWYRDGYGAKSVNKATGNQTTPIQSKTDPKTGNKSTAA